MRVPTIALVLTAPVALALALALALGGCGGGSAMSKSEFVRKANAVCADQKPQLDKLGTPNVDVQSGDLTNAQLSEVADFFDAGVKIQRATVSKLRDLGYPKGDQATLTKIYDRADKGTDEIAAAADAARAGDLKKLRSALEAGTDDLDAAQHAINAYGLDTCGNA